ncbi:uncharacterized mitochondrial protein AtMg00860-like [Nicotiana tomentosiformis]|uniref:uncharacterized mitochondrial protein AtMg00860-like n=1 Tax=Nicotiana tomentosiformis TaxID=4098 RepID=UPI00388C81D0
MEEHEQRLRVVLQTLREQKLYVKFSKCEFWLDSVALLGNVLSGEGIKVDPKKIEVVQSWHRRNTATEIRSFLGFVGYYRWFLEGFSSIAAPLTRLTQKGAPFHCLQHLFKQRDLYLRQRRWFELLKDYDITILYHPGKPNVVADALSRKAGSIGSLAFILAKERPLALDI